MSYLAVVEKITVKAGVLQSYWLRVYDTIQIWSAFCLEDLLLYGNLTSKSRMAYG